MIRAFSYASGSPQRAAKAWRGVYPHQRSVTGLVVFRSSHDDIVCISLGSRGLLVDRFLDRDGTSGTSQSQDWVISMRFHLTVIRIPGTRKDGKCDFFYIFWGMKTFTWTLPDQSRVRTCKLDTYGIYINDLWKTIFFENTYFFWWKSWIKKICIRKIPKLCVWIFGIFRTNIFWFTIFTRKKCFFERKKCFS